MSKLMHKLACCRNAFIGYFELSQANLVAAKAAEQEEEEEEEVLEHKDDHNDEKKAAESKPSCCCDSRSSTVQSAADVVGSAINTDICYHERTRPTKKRKKKKSSVNYNDEKVIKVPKGCVPVAVGLCESQREVYAVHVSLLGRPPFSSLLQESALAFGYSKYSGPLRIAIDTSSFACLLNYGQPSCFACGLLS